eukprot:2669419-Rhodomonas_salina.2
MCIRDSSRPPSLSWAARRSTQSWRRRRCTTPPRSTTSSTSRRGAAAAARSPLRRVPRRPSAAMARPDRCYGDASAGAMADHMAQCGVALWLSLMECCCQAQRHPVLRHSALWRSAL